jgi:hypothetical protein
MIPTVGHIYEMTIVNTHPAQGYSWYYTIWDKTTGLAEGTQTLSSWSGGGQAVWYGFEASNVNDVLGVSTGSNRTFVAPTWFRRTNSNTLIANSGLLPQVSANPGAPKPWFHAAPVWWAQQGDGVYATTDAH